MNKKVIISLILILLVAGGAAWFLRGDKPAAVFSSYDNELDSIFFNIHFGMQRQAFYDTCWKLNKTGGFIQGVNNLSVQHEIKTEFGSPVHMNFYPNFSEKEEIFQMPVEYNYQNWAPWNRQYFSDSLIVTLANKFEKKYHTKFKVTRTADGRPAYTAYDGPRKILMTTKDEQYVKVMMENARYK
ncbi:MAG: hypothetical protein M3R25_11265 [Bacteroidota bacterium]|nr:hypothetical protein [Bacteroidota bacterium]